MLEPLRREFHLSDAQLGGLTTVFTLVYAVAGLPLGRLADRWSRRWLLAIGVAVWAGLTGLAGIATSYGMLLVTRLGVGAGEAVCAPAATSWIGDVVGPERRARALAWFMMAIPVGGILSFAVTGPVAQAYGWRIALATAAIPAVLLIPALLVMPEPRGARAGASQGKAPDWRVLLKMPAFWWIVISGAVVNFALYSFSTFLPAFLTRVHGLSIARAGLVAGFGSGIAGILGALAAGWKGDRTAEAAPRLRLAAWAALVAAVPGFLAIRSQAAAAAIVLLMVAYGILQTYYGLVYAAIQDLVVPGAARHRDGRVFHRDVSVRGFVRPSGHGPFERCSGEGGRGVRVPSRKRHARRGLHQAMYVIPALSVVLAVVLWGAARASARPHPAE